MNYDCILVPTRENKDFDLTGLSLEEIIIVGLFYTVGISNPPNPETGELAVPELSEIAEETRKDMKEAKKMVDSLKERGLIKL